MIWCNGTVTAGDRVTDVTPCVISYISQNQTSVLYTLRWFVCMWSPDHWSPMGDHVVLKCWRLINDHFYYLCIKRYLMQKQVKWSAVKDQPVTWCYDFFFYIINNFISWKVYVGITFGHVRIHICCSFYISCALILV